MKHPKGVYQREAVKSHLRRFCPVRSAHELNDVVPEDLFQSGKKLVLIDADNTILKWKSEDIPQSSRDWVDRAKAAGLQLCLVSNTRNRPRLERLSTELGIGVASGKFKPSKEMYLWAINEYKVSAIETIMIGDQIFTDILGANRAGIEAILLRPIHHTEFVGTKINRFFEKLLHPSLSKAMETAADDLEILGHQGIFQRKIVRQFAKFCLVGGTSFFIDYNIRMTLVHKASSGGTRLSELIGQNIRDYSPFFQNLFTTNLDAFFPIAAFCGASVAIFNSFFLNRLWTFEIRNPSEKASQFKRFFVISIVGLVLNTVISSTINAMLHGDEKMATRIATVSAAVIVAFWNFFGQRLYAFKVTDVKPV